MATRRTGTRWNGVTLVLLALLAGAPLPPERAGAQEARAEGGVRAADGSAADDGADHAAREQRAREAFERGSEAYGRGDFETALEAFRESFEQTRDVGARVRLYVNIAQALDRLGRDEEALDAYRRYLELMPDGPKSGIAEGRVRVLERRVAERREAERQRRERERALLAEAERQREAARASRRGAWWPWAVAGGAVLLAGGVAAWLLLRDGPPPEKEVVLPPVEFRVEALRP